MKIGVLALQGAFREHVATLGAIGVEGVEVRLPEDLVDILTVNKLHYSHGTESGVLFHLIGALSEFGKLGLTAIANSPAQVDDLYSHTLEVLDRETTYGR